MPGLDALGADHRAATHVFLQQMECFRGAATSVLSCCSAYVPEPRGILHEVSALVKEVSTTAACSWLFRQEADKLQGCSI